MKTLLATAAVVLAVTAGAMAGDNTDLGDVEAAIAKRYPTASDFYYGSGLASDEVTFSTAKRHMSCRYSFTGSGKPVVSKCRVIHG